MALTIRIEDGREDQERDARNRIRAVLKSDASRYPRIAAIHRVVFPCTCAYCRRTFWDGNEYSSVCSDTMCIRAHRNDWDDE